MYGFIERMLCNDEFEFIYQNVKYEIVYDWIGKKETVLSLFLCDGTKTGKLIKRFENKEDFFANCFIEDKNVMTIIDDLILI